MTQPGWAFATQAEMRSRDISLRTTLLHRDSTLLLPGSGSPDEDARLQALRTPSEVCGVIANARRQGTADAAWLLRRSLNSEELKAEVLRWLPLAPRSGVRRYSIACESWGRTALQRNQLEAAIRRALKAAFPRWRELPAGGLRIVCKADPEAAIVAVQLASNLEQTPGRTGALRRHLAASLLTLAGVQDGDTIFDPFVGSGTILRAALESIRNVRCIGADEDAEVVQAIRAPLADRATLMHTPVERIDVESLPDDLRLVSNLPFGVQFERVRDDELLRFLRSIRPRCRGIALLLSREQARHISRPLGLRARNVLVLGQPAAIVYRHD